LPIPELQPNYVIIRNEVIGINYIDTYHRSGVYPGLSFPYTLGRDGAGQIVQLSKEAESLFKVGDRVTYFAPNSYGQYVAVPSSRVVRLPDSISYDQATAAMVQGLTGHYLVNDSYNVQKGDTVLIHACAGGMGLTLIQMCKLKGANIIGTCSSASKAALAASYGLDPNNIVIYCSPEFPNELKFVDQVKKLTNGKGCHVVFDSIGKNTIDTSLECLRPLGTLVSFGNSSGKVPPFDIYKLAKGSYKLTRPVLDHHVATREALQQRADAVFEMINNGSYKIEIGGRYKLSEAVTAHKDLEQRKTTGKLVLIP